MENQQKNSAPENNSDNRNSNNNKKKPSKTVVIWIVSILLTFMIWQGITAIQQSKQEKITYDTFLQMLDDKLVTDVKLYNDRISFTPISKETGAEMDKTYYVIRISDYKIVDRLQKAGVQFEEMDEGKNAVVSTILSYVVMIGAFYLLMSLLMRNMSKSGGIGKSNAKMYVEWKRIVWSGKSGKHGGRRSLEKIWSRCGGWPSSCAGGISAGSAASGRTDCKKFFLVWKRTGKRVREKKDSDSDRNGNIRPCHGRPVVTVF